MQSNTRKWIPVVTETSRRTITVQDLRCGTDYEFKVRAVTEDGEEGPFSPTLKISTKMSLEKSIQCDAKKIKNGNPSVFKLPLVESRDTTNFKAKTRKYTFGKYLYIYILYIYIYIYGADVVKWSRALDVRLSDWCCSVSMV